MTTTTVQPLRTTIDGQQLRRVMGDFATGVTVMTTGGSDPDAMTLNALASVSLDPALILTCVGNASRMVAALHREGRFGVSILASDQSHIAENFADRDRLRGRQAFRDYRTHQGPRTGVPLFSDAMAWLECRIHESIVAGDHTIYIGEVLRGARGRPAQPLLFHSGTYPTVCHGRCGKHDLTA